MNKLKTIVVFLYITSLLSCKKDSSQVNNVKILGRVLNLCTNKNLANVQVSLLTKGPKGGSLSVLSDGNGDFSFNNISINMSSDYVYSVYIESKSGIGNGPEAGFDGVEVDINKNDLGHFFILGVVPHFKYWQLYFPNTTFTNLDTFVLTYVQKIFHANVPQNPNYRLVDSCPCPIVSPTNYVGGFNNYWMGWWYVTYNKTKNGMHTIKTDSFYVDWGANKTDTMPF